MAFKKPNLMSILSSLAPVVCVLSKGKIRNELGLKKKE